MVKPPAADRGPGPFAGITPSAAILLTGQHLDAFSRLMLFPIPLLIILMAGFISDEPSIDFLGASIPRPFAEGATRLLILLCLAQCTNHLYAIWQLAREFPGRNHAELRWNAALVNPFFEPPRVKFSDLAEEPLWFLWIGLLPRHLSAQFGAAFILTFAVLFETSYAPYIIGSWYDSLATLSWFDADLAAHFERRGAEWARLLAPDYGSLRSLDTYVTGLMGALLMAMLALVVRTVRTMPRDKFPVGIYLRLALGCGAGIIGALTASAYLATNARV